MKKLLIITPHLSTGGAPQVTVNKIELLQNDFDIKVIEWDLIAWAFVVQRNRIIRLVGEQNFYSLGENKLEQLSSILDEFQPDTISMEEFPEMFMSTECANYLYSSDRSWRIVETTHDSSFNPKSKTLFPDMFVFVSAYNAFKYIHLDVPMRIIEYPVDKKQRIKVDMQKKLGLDPSYKHLITVGLFTPRKNQAYAFELAERLKNYKIKFHFLGNQAGNFESYWQPLMQNKPENCVVWGERDDVTDFLEASDVFFFPSKGDRGNKELNPIAIKEALQYDDLIKLMYNLDVYCNKYDDEPNMVYLTGDISTDATNMISFLNINNMNEEVIVVGTYPNLKKRVDLTKQCIESLKPLGRKIILVSHYPVDQEIQKMVDYYVYDKHNPMTTHSYYTLFYSRYADYDVDVNINQLHNGNQSLAVLTNMFNGFKHAKEHGFKRLFYVTFDIIIDPRDIPVIDESFNTVSNGKKAYLGIFKSVFEYGVQTNGMTFNIDYFIENFDDVRDVDSYNRICSEIGAQNFLEDYLAKKLDRLDKSEMYIRPMKQISGDETFLEYSGTGVSSHSEYYSILPVVGKENTFMFYFFTYNVDDRVVKGNIGDVFFQFDIAKTKEYKYEFAYTGKQIDINFEFYDGDNMYKRETHTINDNTISKYRDTGKFLWKNIKPKIKLVHIQTTLNDEREQASRASLEQVKSHGWEYILQLNVPYADLPPKYNCIRPDCVSMELFDEARIQQYGTALTPAHYGCYQAFKNAILTEFHDCDFLMVCEGDCIIETDVHFFVQKVEECAHLLGPNNIEFMSFGDKDTLEHGWPQSPVIEEVNDVMYITNHVIGLQCIMFPAKIAKELKDTVRTHPWDAADMYFNYIFAGRKMGILHNRITTQADGFSLIDNSHKTFRK
jgi:glycosyltransferase involved in cell wall biosynthesis